jgi:hypothetical protein
LLWVPLCLTSSLCAVRVFMCAVRAVRYSYMGSCDGPHAFYTSYSLAQREVTTWKRRGGQVQQRAHRLAADQSFFDVVDRKLAKRKCPIGTPHATGGGLPMPAVPDLLKAPFICDARARVQTKTCHSILWAGSWATLVTR